VPTWAKILEELQASAAANNGQPDFDLVRRKYLTQLHALTGRDTILYSTAWMAGKQDTSIVLEDIQGFMGALKGLRGPGLDLILHSPGGSPDATASIVRYLRQRFGNIRVFVPLAAMSAATMLSLAANEIWMGAHSQLGPIDPQMVSGSGAYPARAILEQFDRAKRELSERPELLSAWLPILQGYGPSLLEQCEQAEELSKRLVRDWLRRYMLADTIPNVASRAAKASRIAAYFANYERHKSHGMGISREAARDKGVVVRDLESDNTLQDAVLSVHHATMHTFNGAAAKIIENHLGIAYVKLQFQQTIQIPVGLQQGLLGVPANPEVAPAEGAS
jgi:Serine dehydrogenase proteinase